MREVFNSRKQCSARQSDGDDGDGDDDDGGGHDDGEMVMMMAACGLVLRFHFESHQLIIYFVKVKILKGK